VAVLLAYRGNWLKKQGGFNLIDIAHETGQSLPVNGQNNPAGEWDEESR
jgi:hypothetical protein